MKIAEVKMPARGGKGAPPTLDSYGLELSEELQVLAVRPGSAAATVPLGATLREIAGYPVESLDDIDQALYSLPGQLGGAGLKFVFTYHAPTSVAAAAPEGVPPVKASRHSSYSRVSPAVVGTLADHHAEATLPRGEDGDPAMDAERVEDIPSTTPLKPTAVHGEIPRSSGRPQPQLPSDPLAMHKPRAQGARRRPPGRPPARGLLATRKKRR